MNKITSIHLNGKAFQLEEAAYEDLQSYLQQSEAKLADNPDKQEIVADFEQAIADKCSARLYSGKDVVTAVEMGDILREMGRVETDTATEGGEAGEADEAESTQAASSAKPKKLYNIPDGAMIAGVCTGLAAYFNLDVTLVRLAFAATAIFTGGGAIVVYIIMALVVPEAKTKGQIAEATGKPLTAQDIVANGRQRFEEVSQSVQKTGAAKKVLIAILVILGIIILFNMLSAVLVMTPWHWGF